MVWTPAATVGSSSVFEFSGTQYVDPFHPPVLVAGPQINLTGPNASQGDDQDYRRQLSVTGASQEKEVLHATAALWKVASVMTAAHRITGACDGKPISNPAHAAAKATNCRES